jgi:hypothetical protein
VLHAERTALDLGHAEVVTRARRALAVVQAALDLRDLYWRGQQPSADRQQASALDHEIDALLTALHRALVAVEGNPVHPHVKGARDLKRLVFPQGLTAHIRAAWEDQLVRNDAAIRRLRAPEHVELVGALLLTPLVDRLADLDTTFEAALHREERVTWEQLQAADRKALDATEHLIHFVLSYYDYEDPTAVEHRDATLLEVVEAERTIHARHLAAKAAAARKAARAREAAGAKEVAGKGEQKADSPPAGQADTPPKARTAGQADTPPKAHPAGQVDHPPQPRAGQPLSPPQADHPTPTGAASRLVAFPLAARTAKAPKARPDPVPAPPEPPDPANVPGHERTLVYKRLAASPT